MSEQFKKINLKRRIALLISICLIGVIILFRSYIIAQTDHSHVFNEYGCTVCLNVQSAEYVLRQMGMAAKVTLLTSSCLLVLFALFWGGSVFSKSNSLIQLKVRMNN